MDSRKPDPLLLALREEIAANDRDLLAAFIRRLRIAAKIRSHKTEQGYDFVDFERERQLLEEWRQANNEEMSDETLLELFETVLRLSKREAGCED